MILARFKRKFGHRAIAVLLIAIGYIFSVVAWRFYSSAADWQYLVQLSVVLYWVSFVFWIVSPMFSTYFIRFHKKLGLLFFQEAINNKQFSPRAVTGTNLMLNFTFFTIAYMLPFREVLCALFPALKPAESFIPASFQQLTQMSQSLYVFVLFVPTVSLGPAFIYTVRYLREKQETRGERLFEFFQIMFYASMILVGLTWYYGVNPYGGSFYGYQAMILTILLPGSLGGAGLLGLLESIKKKLPYIT